MHGKLLKPRDVAERLKVNKRTVTNWLQRKSLRGCKTGKEWRIAEDDLRTFLDIGVNKSLSDEGSIGK